MVPTRSQRVGSQLGWADSRLGDLSLTQLL